MTEVEVWIIDQLESLSIKREQTQRSLLQKSQADQHGKRKVYSCFCKERQGHPALQLLSPTTLSVEVQKEESKDFQP